MGGQSHSKCQSNEVMAVVRLESSHLRQRGARTIETPGSLGEGPGLTRDVVSDPVFLPEALHLAGQDGLPRF